jgi:hypothetical protein
MELNKRKDKKKTYVCGDGDRRKRHWKYARKKKKFGIY